MARIEGSGDNCAGTDTDLLGIRTGAAVSGLGVMKMRKTISEDIWALHERVGHDGSRRANNDLALSSFIPTENRMTTNHANSSEPFLPSFDDSAIISQC